MQLLCEDSHHLDGIWWHDDLVILCGHHHNVRRCVSYPEMSNDIVIVCYNRNKDYVLELTGIFAVGGVEILLIMLLICLRIVGKIVRRIRA